MSEHLIINDTFGKSQKVLEKMTGQTIDELESVENVMLLHTPAEIGHIVDEINHIEIKGVENYAQQFQEFVKGFPGAEAPFIFAGLNAFLEAALSAPPFNDPEIKQKYDYCRENLKERALAVMFANVPKKKPEGDE